MRVRRWQARLGCLVLAAAATAFASGTASGAPRPDGPTTDDPAIPDASEFASWGIEIEIETVDRASGRRRWVRLTPREVDALSEARADGTVEISAARDVARRVPQALRPPIRRTLQTNGCWGIRVARVARSLLGSVLFRHWLEKHWCASGNTITPGVAFADPVRQDATWFYRGEVTTQSSFFTWCCAVARSGHTTYTKGSWEQCLLGTCLSQLFPWVRVNAQANGQYTSATGGT
ncbi:MAG: hypothetical protein R3C15_14125 [Thermoleophilia bacterium]